MENGVMERKTGKTRPKHSPKKIGSNRIDCFLVSHQYQGSRGRIKGMSRPNDPAIIYRTNVLKERGNDVFRESN
ncbi:hypothetical protein BS47DRAFT_1340390 [Hydnum rufescens UP504]|uniref:Uncharacterized protein n=1 Tax=Hydnum rufescens UP504 TaxID=1448309 RepID=A0A9P6DZ84_9AGAM|nr:hypothetical protein BS47DRAFT_1340390 [Hydnum rufescens UP504]